ncbi:MAG: hypothetical protein AMJ58_06230 [Gammaproteobacteria bacterium SG8_30]|jgi:hypothetical protein|nr:MAG: hypothetical protein AMJ58_06230 [Gammaproteobacteria bacterium SG8_30]
MPPGLLQRRDHTHWLSQASFALEAHDPARRRMKWAGLVLLVLLLVAAARGVVADLLDLEAAREDQALATAEADRLRSQLAVEAATRRQLEQHAADLGAEVEELTRQVEFLSARKGSGTRAN